MGQGLVGGCSLCGFRIHLLKIFYTILQSNLFYIDKSMGLLKWICNLFSCKSDCVFNAADCDIDLLDIDLSKYILKNEDLKVIQNIRNKRPSSQKYVHSKPRIKGPVSHV
jgi:hypothetical protein